MFRWKLKIKNCTADSQTLVSLPFVKINNPSVNYLSKWQRKQTWFSTGRTSHAVYFNDLFSTLFFAAEKSCCLFKINFWDKKRRKWIFKWRFALRKPLSLSHDYQVWRSISRLTSLCGLHSANYQRCPWEVSREFSHDLSISRFNRPKTFALLTSHAIIFFLL